MLFFQNMMYDNANQRMKKVIMIKQFNQTKISWKVPKESTEK